MKKVVIRRLHHDIKNLIALSVLSLLSILFIEYICRSSIKDTLFWVKEAPVAFLLNAFLFMSFHSLFFFLKKPWVWIALSSTFFYFLSVVNYFKLFFKNEVLIFQDFLLLADINGIITKYIEFYHIILFICYIVFIVWICKWIWKKQKNQPYSWYLGVFAIPFFFFLPFMATQVDISPNRENSNSSYLENGFFYSFFESGESLKVSLPPNYTDENIKKIKKHIPSSKHFKGTDANVIFVQLESFFDPYTLSNIALSEDPIPAFHALQKQFPSGNITVPVYGGTTANSELELLTGFDVKGFPPKTVPYVNYLKDRPIESLAHYYRKKGYTTFALHNHEMTFFSRHKVYKNMGFDYFIGKEAFPKKEYNLTGWMKDSLLMEQIDEAIKKSKTRDFIFGVGVQSHGFYPNTPLYENVIDVTSPSLSDEEKISFQNYLHELKEVDASINLLIEKANSWNEPTVIVFYGDHLPNLGEQGSFYENLDYNETYKYETPYVVWNNIGLKNETKHLPLSQLSTHVLNLLNESGTLMNQFHRAYDQHPQRKETQYLLQYDLIFGNSYAYYKETFPYPMKKVGYVMNPPKIHRVENMGGGLLITGSHFIDNLKLKINNRTEPIQYLSPTTIFVPEKELEDNQEFLLYLEDTNGDMITKAIHLYK